MPIGYNRNAIRDDDDHATLATADGRIEARHSLPDEDVPPATYFSASPMNGPSWRGTFMRIARIIRSGPMETSSSV